MKNRWMMAAVAALGVVSVTAAVAQTKMDSGMDKGKMHGKMTGKGVYVCKECKAYYSASDAKKMKMTDPMGHKLTRMTKAPAGYKMEKMGDGMMDKKDKK